MEKVSIVILTHNALKYCRILFNTITQTTGVEYEIVVVDNNSVLATRLYLGYLFNRKRINRLALLNYNSFFSAGNNMGVDLSAKDSQFILLLNSDIEIKHPQWLTKLIGIHKPGVTSYGLCAKEWPHADGYCFLIDREIYQKYKLDEQYLWWGAISTLQTKLVADGYSIQAIANHEKYIHHFGGKSGKDYESVNYNYPAQSSFAILARNKLITVIEDID